MAATFTDDLGREWQLRLDHSLVRSIRDAIGIDLHSIEGQSAAFQAFADKPELLVDAVYLVCEKQCQRRKISDEEFGSGFAGDTYAGAATAFMEAVINFTPPPRRQAVQIAAKLTTGAMQTAVQKATEALAEAVRGAEESLSACGR